jgi:DUF1680 family protein
MGFAKKKEMDKSVLNEYFQGKEMRKITPIFIFFVLVFAVFMSCSKKTQPEPDYSVEPVSFVDVDIQDDFWRPKMDINQSVSIWHCFQKYEETGHLASPKLIEGAAYMLAKRSDPRLEAYVDELIDESVSRVESALEAKPESAVRISGHFFEAAVAYYEATGKKKMLDTALKAADLIDEIYGPGKKTYISGHEGLKIGLIRLFRHTHEKKYWKLAKFFLDERGKEGYARTGEYAKYREYAQDHKPVIEQEEAVGHCVRAMFLYIPLVDIAALTGEQAYAAASQRIWEDSVFKKTYLTGGVGAIRFHEQFGKAYELPNLSAWNETCAAYGNVVWNHRKFLQHHDAEYIDLMERILYNGWLAGVSLDGDRFFYQNPLKSFGNYERFDWINVPCCPPNIVRLMSSIGSYIYAKSKKDIYINLFIGSQAEIALDKTIVRLVQETRYPWEGKVKLTIDPVQESSFSLNMRLPMWTRNQPMPGDLYHYMEQYDEQPVLKINGEIKNYEIEKGYACLRRKWKKNDIVEIELPMRARKVLSHENIRHNKGLVALERGPLVYCVEWDDNDGNVLNLVIDDDAVFVPEFRKDLLDGITVLNGGVLKLVRGEDKRTIESEKFEVTAIPYYAWANRGMGEMAVWMPRGSDDARIKPIIPPLPICRVKSSGGIPKIWTGYNDQNDDIVAVYDGVEPLSSADESHLYFRMRPALGQQGWIQYDFENPVRVSSSEVYFVDDRRFCLLPESWRILYKQGNEWLSVHNRDPYTVERDRFNTVTFDPVTTSAVRIEIEPQTILYKARTIGPPEALFIDKDIEWREYGLIEWRVGLHKNGN